MEKEKGGNVEQRTLELVKPMIEEAGYKLWDVCFEKEGAMWYLRILFDKEGGIDSEDCEKMTEPINKLIDKQDFLGLIDILDIGSPGLNKKLRKPEHFTSCLEQPVKVFERDEKGKTVTRSGILAAYDGEAGTITVRNDDGESTAIISKCIKITADL